MLILEIVCSVVILFFAGMYLYWGRVCFRLYQSRGRQQAEGNYRPSATVILPLRGNDPFLKNCLQGLLNQDYPHYEVKIIVDHFSDPVLKVVNEYLAEHSHPHCEVSVLENRTGLCGLKNESLIQGLETLDDSVEVVAWLDADVIPHSSWLRDLVAPLQDPEVGVTSGVRWYAPRDRNPGTLVRYVWNSGAVIQMLSLEIPWGGSVALSRKVFRSEFLTESWSKMLWEDTYLKTVVSRLNLKLVFVPEVTMVNEESTSLKSCFQFITRQLMNTRFYHPHWRFISLLGICSAVAQLILIFLSCLFAVQGELLQAGRAAAILLSVSLCVVLVLGRMDSLIRRQIFQRGVTLQRLPLMTLGVLWPTLFVYCAALIAAMKARTILWRGVIYDAVSPFDVQILHYAPYEQTVRDEIGTENTSIN